MKFQVFQRYFSAPRVNRYLVSTNNSTNKAVTLYKLNLKIAQGFHPLLGVLEVVLRNQINDLLSSYFNDSNWIINQKTGFMIDPSLTFTHKKTNKRQTNDFLRTEVEKAERRLRKLGVRVTTGKIIAEQNFAFLD